MLAILTMTKRIRVVDDNADLALLMRAVLRDRNIDMVTTTNHFSRLLSPAPWIGVDVAIIDLMLPGITGEEVLQYLHDHHPDIMRIVYSAVTEQRPDAKRLAHVFYSKPNMPVDNLVWAIEDFFGEC